MFNWLKKLFNFNLTPKRKVNVMVAPQMKYPRYMREFDYTENTKNTEKY